MQIEKKWWIVIGVAVALCSSSSSYIALRGSGGSSMSAIEEQRRRAIIAALLEQELAKTQKPKTAAPQPQQPQMPQIPLIPAAPDVNQRRNVNQTTPDLPKDALCNSRSDPATYLQCCANKSAAGTLDATCMMYLKNGKITN
jgi:hypothetical protein